MHRVLLWLPRAAFIAAQGCVIVLRKHLARDMSHAMIRNMPTKLYRFKKH